MFSEKEVKKVYLLPRVALETKNMPAITVAYAGAQFDPNLSTPELTQARPNYGAIYFFELDTYTAGQNARRAANRIFNDMAQLDVIWNRRTDSGGLVFAWRSHSHHQFDPTQQSSVRVQRSTLEIRTSI